MSILVQPIFPALSRDCFALEPAPRALDPHAWPLPDLRDAHTPVPLPTHRHLV